MSIHVKQNWWETLFDETYLLTDARSVCDDDVTKREVELICEILDIRRDHRILDLCGGHGRHSFALYSRGNRNCTLVDYSECLLRKAREHGVEHGIPIKIIRADARRTGLRPDQFDRVCILGNSLGYISEDDADVRIIREARRLLRAGGRILVDVADGDYVLESFNPVAWHEIGEDTVVCRQREIQEGQLCARELVLSKGNGLVRDESYSIRLFNEQGIRSLLAENGFVSVMVHKGFSAHELKGDYGFMNNRMVAIGVKG